MKRDHQPKHIAKALEHCSCKEVLAGISAPLFLAEYAAGEAVSGNGLFQVVTCGTLSISFVRADGSAYHLSSGGAGYIIGEMNLFSGENEAVLAVATSPLKALAVDTALHRETLLSDNAFLRLIGETMARKMEVITDADAAPGSLPERVLNYIRFKCDNRELRGVENAAFRLRCSARQLQRVLNRLAEEGRIEKTGKGRYRLLPAENE
ncbi:MAG: hypothetical protein Q4C53_08265 [Clostridia bacterium]|nr:hypothetical protein [Clostridia bacterium]